MIFTHSKDGSLRGFRCDSNKCPNEFIFRTERTLDEADFIARANGWTVRGDHHLCAACARLTDKNNGETTC